MSATLNLDVTLFHIKLANAITLELVTVTLSLGNECKKVTHHVTFFKSNYSLTGCVATGFSLCLRMNSVINKPKANKINTV